MHAGVRVAAEEGRRSKSRCRGRIDSFARHQPLHYIGGYRDDGDDFIEMLFEMWDKQKWTTRVDVKDDVGNTPLHEASKCRNRQVAALLLIRGADPKAANEDGKTPRHFLCRRNDDDGLAEMLFEFCDEQQLKIRVDARDKLGNAPLHLALADRHYMVAELLLRRGVDMNLANNDGETPLHLIGRKKVDVDFVKLFFEICEEKRQTLQIDARDKLGRMPLEWAVANLLPNTFDVLLDNGADPTGFVFPTKSQFDASFECKGDEDFNFFPSPLVEKKFRTRWKFKQAANALAVLERLEKRGGYELDQCDALTIVKFFAEHGYLESRAELENKSPYGTETRGSRRKRKR
uniref:Uncharacterized protein n=1 Tax=Trichogramma kaykai TaxID=54128 RepID=A0ABD2XL81_9HYME